MNEECIWIIDFGSQTTKLIARRLREMNIFSEIKPLEALNVLPEAVKGIILSGSPSSTSSAGHTLPAAVLSGNIPVLGICYGMQLLSHLNSGKVSHAGRGEYGKGVIQVDKSCPLFKNLPERQRVWMSHGDSVLEPPRAFRVVSKSEEGLIAAIAHEEKPLYGVQFHPEVTHTERGAEILSNFIDLCTKKRSWTIAHTLDVIKEEIRSQVGSGQVVSLVSGGVDSTASTLLCVEALGPDRVLPIHIDSGLMRHGESEQVLQLLKEHGMKNLHFIDASRQFLKALDGIEEAEEKRRVIGDLFITLMDEELKNLEDAYLCQGTLYTDLIESGKGCGTSAQVIKSHHNVSSPYVAAKREAGKIVEPNRHFFKDEVRKVAEALGVPHHLAWRHPFPGPGLAIRIMGAVTEERLKKLRHADKIAIDTLTKAGFYDKIWQAFTVLIPVKTVGVMGDARKEGEVIALRAIESVDGMTADVSPLPFELLGEISTRIVNEVPGICRVVYDITSKPPATIEWE